MIFVETQVFTRLLNELVTDDAYAAFQQFLLADPHAGHVIKGTVREGHRCAGGCLAQLGAGPA